ncbi:MAG: hypothetical protein DSZ29_01465 [Aquificaceae bacterium]|nr:MAG: hypothetical protein DSZ29_01465 [Aquificaceae bacterium]
MNIKISPIVSSIVLASLLTACGGHNPKTPPNNNPSFTKTQLNNEGSICLYTKKNNDIKVYYFPLNSSCSSSSANHWSNKKLTANATFRRSLKGSLIEINASATHRRSNSGIATADCAGAGIQTKLLAMTGNHRFEVYWDNHKLGDYSSSKGAIMCKKMDKKGVVSSAPPRLQEYVSMMARHTW